VYRLRVGYWQKWNVTIIGTDGKEVSIQENGRHWGEVGASADKRKKKKKEAGGKGGRSLSLKNKATKKHPFGGWSTPQQKTNDVQPQTLKMLQKEGENHSGKKRPGELFFREARVRRRKIGRAGRPTKPTKKGKAVNGPSRRARVERSP